MVLVGHAQRVAKPLTTRQRRVVVVAVVAMALALTWVVLGTQAATPSAHGCINVVVASSTGGGTIHDCGAAARSICRSDLTAHGRLAEAIETQCRIAGIVTLKR
jgi:hypothetical protein